MNTTLRWLTNVACPWRSPSSSCATKVACGLQPVELKTYVVASASRTCDRKSAIQVSSHRRRRMDGNEDLLVTQKTEIVQPRRVEPNEEEQATRHSQGFHVKDEIDLTKLIRTKEEFSSNAMAVLDKIGGWDEEGRFGGEDRYDGSHT